MDIRTALSEWVDKTFGGIHRGDQFVLNEDVLPTKERGIYERKITVGLKKYQGFKKSWTDEETFARWKEEIKEIIGGKADKIAIKSAEGNELRYIKEGKESEGRIFAYHFTISIIKREVRHGE